MAAKRHEPLHFDGDSLAVVKVERLQSGGEIRRLIAQRARKLRVQPEMVFGYPHLIRVSIYLSKGGTSALLRDGDSIEIFDGDASSRSSLIFDAESGTLIDSSVHPKPLS